MNLVHRQIDVTFAMGEGRTFDATGKNTITFSGLRASVNVSNAGMPMRGQLSLRLYGLSMSHMNQLTLFGRVWYNAIRQNTVEVLAGDSQNGMSLVCTGDVIEAWPDGSAAPEMPFIVEAQIGGLLALKPIAPTSYNGPIDVAVLLDSLCRQVSLGFDSSAGVSVVLTNPYFPGTAMQQIQAAVYAAGINATIENNVLHIWPRDGTRIAPTVLISPDNGLVGYPTFMQDGVALTTLYNPAIGFGMTAKVQSQFQAACGTWTINGVAHQLESETPHGAWYTHLLLNPFGHNPTLPRSPG